MKKMLPHTPCDSTCQLPTNQLLTSSVSTITCFFFRVATDKDRLYRLLILVITLLPVPYALRAQVKIGDNLSNVNANAILELESTTKALLLPRLNQAQIDIMQNVPAGMLVYNSTANSLYIRTSTGWTSLLSAANSALGAAGWTNNDGTIYTTDPASKVGIGISNPYAQLANTNVNTTGSDTQGGGRGSLNWAASQSGYVGQLYNGGTAANNNGLVVKVNSTTATAFDVSRGAQNGYADPLFTVKSNQRVGINTASPMASLDVKGNILADRFDLGIQYFYEDHTVNPFYTESYTLGCPTGTKPIGGGGGGYGNGNGDGDVYVNYSGPDPDALDTNWGLNVLNSYLFGKRTVRIYVICAKVQ